jgi:hypothetical protein
MATLLWLLLAFVYVTLALTTLRKGHTVLSWSGIIFPARCGSSVP